MKRRKVTGGGKLSAREQARVQRPSFVYGSDQHIVLIGDIVTGFEAFGPFESGHDAIEWKGSTGVREIAHGQWYLMQLKEPIRGNKP